MRTARIIYRYLTALFLADVLLQFFLAGAGVFSAGPGTAARDSSTLDPHRGNGMLVMILALLLLAAALAARNGRWRWALPLFVLTLLQPVLAIAGAAGGLHVLNAARHLGHRRHADLPRLAGGPRPASRAHTRGGPGAAAAEPAATRPAPSD